MEIGGFLLLLDPTSKNDKHFRFEYRNEGIAFVIFGLGLQMLSTLLGF